MDNILEVKNLSISFGTGSGRVQAVRDVSFSLKRGETLALVGESGSGKSVSTRAVMGILSPNAKIDRGEILFEGKSILELGERDMCRLRGDKIAMIFQDPMSSLNPIVKVGRQLCEAMLLKKRCKRSEAKKRAVRLLSEVGIPNPESSFDKYPFEFSGGQRQRIVIAIALCTNPELLICDEPTTALDVTIQAQILELIERLKRERGLSVIFITHDLGVVARVADRIAVMYAGKILEYGLCDEVFYDPRHPYTWALLCSTPDLDTQGRLSCISGTPPNMSEKICGDAFAPRNPYALKIDFECEPPLFAVSPTHSAATWLLHPDAPKVEMPRQLSERIARSKKELYE